MANLRALQHVIHTAPLEIPHQAPELARHCRQAAIVTNLGLQRRIENPGLRSEEHTSELQSLMRISYAVFCLKKKKKLKKHQQTKTQHTILRLVYTRHNQKESRRIQS